MTFTVSPWLVWAGLSLVLFGAWFVLSAVGNGLRQLWGWVRRDRVTELLDYPDDYPDEALTEWQDSLPPLPPERSWEQMTSHQLPVVAIPPASERATTGRVLMYAAERERRPPAYEAEQRAHYVAMGFDYPSGLMARVRELTP